MEFYDENTNLSYFNARYYDASRGQFLSDDPSFLAVGDPNKLKQVTGMDQQRFLADPQQMNDTSYGRDNPITNKDPQGTFANILAGAIVGDFVGIGSQLYSDISTGRTSGVSTYIAAGLGGATNGAAIASGGYWYGPVGGLAGGTVQSSINQTAGILNGTNGSFSYSDVVGTALYQKAFGLIPGLRLSGVTVGRNSFEAIAKNAFTRYDNGYINNIGVQTAAKAFTANIVRNAPSTAAQSYMSVPANTQSLVAGLTSLVSSLQSLVQSLSSKK